MITVRKRLSPNMILLCVDTYEETIMTGRIFSTMMKGPICFENFEHLILRADELFDELAFPQAFQKKRSFGVQKKDSLDFATIRKNAKIYDEDVLSHRGALHTFIVLIESRQHTNWQGKVLTNDFKEIAEFKDVIDLLNILIQAIV